MDEDNDDDDIHIESRHQEEEGEEAILAGAFRDPKLARVLTACPQVVPFNQRVQMFHSLVEGDKLTTQDDAAAQQSMLRHMLLHGDEPFRHRIHVRVRRDDLFTDSLRQLNTYGKKLREKVQVTMINKHGTEESGIDGGGVFKEFLDDLIRESFFQNTADGSGLFAVSPLETLYVNPSAISSIGQGISADLLLQYEFLGRVLGKAVYESILVEPQFSLAFLNLILGKQNSLDDLKLFDPELSRHLSSLRKMDEEVLASLGLTFEVTSAYTTRGHSVISTAGTSSVPLLPQGESIPVTKSNVIQYVHLVAHHKLNVEGSVQTKAFLRGFRDLIPAPWVRLFSALELQKLISGDDAVRGIDVEDMKRSMLYAGGYHPSQQIIIWFWEVLVEMSPEQQRKFLKFMTSCSRQPLLGFQALTPLPCIQQIHLDDSNRERLPTSSTCMNLLKLPKYDSKETLRAKLLYAVEAGAGFELT
jgi:ubiquitin-protein ligase E3 C